MLKLNGKAVPFGMFPNLEIKMDEKFIRENVRVKMMNLITFKFETNKDLIHLMFLKRFMDAILPKHAEVILQIAYMPYSRMDRSEGGSAFTLKYVADFINLMNFDTVHVVEPHSDVSIALLDRAVADYPTVELLSKVMEMVEYDKSKDYLVYPDAGAQKRYGKVTGFPFLTANKKRNFETGKIESIEVDSSLMGMLHKDAKAIILDDLCSRGGTFIGTAEKLKGLGFKEIYLLVAHTEQAIYSGDILKTDLIDKVFTTNTMLNETEVHHNKIHIFPLV